MYEEVELTKEQLEAGYELRKELSSKFLSFALLTSKGRRIKFEEHGCYYPLNLENLQKDEKCILFIDKSCHGCVRLAKGKWDALKYIDWIANKSVWSRVLLTKDAEEIVSKGAIIKTDWPFKFCLQAAYLLRDSVQNSGKVVSFLEFSKWMDENAALVLASSLVGSTADNYFWPVGYMIGHSAMEGNENGKATIDAIANEDFSRFKSPPMRDVASNFYGMNQLWEEPNTSFYVGFRLKLKIKVKQVETKDSFGHKILRNEKVALKNLPSLLLTILKDNDLLKYAKPALLEYVPPVKVEEKPKIVKKEPSYRKLEKLSGPVKPPVKKEPLPDNVDAIFKEASYSYREPVMDWTKMYAKWHGEALSYNKSIFEGTTE